MVNRKNGFETIPKKIKNNIDLAIICTPTNDHKKKSLIQCFKINPKIILCEKPISNNISDLKHILKLKPRGTNLLINYNRRSNKFYINLKKLIKEKKFGLLRSITAGI